MSDPQPPPPGPPAAPPPPGAAGAAPPDRPSATEPPAGLLATAVGVITAPGPTLRQVTAQPRLSSALVVAVVVAALTSIGNAADAPVQAGPMAEGLAVAAAVIGPVLQLALLALGALVVLGAARLLGGTGGYLATFAGMAFALVPWTVTAALPLLGVVAGFPGRVVSGVLAGLVAVWVVALTVVAVQSTQGLSTGRALAATLAPVLAVGAALGLLIALVAALVAAIGMAAFA